MKLPEASHVSTLITSCILKHNVKAHLFLRIRYRVAQRKTLYGLRVNIYEVCRWRNRDLMKSELQCSFVRSSKFLLFIAAQTLLLSRCSLSTSKTSCLPAHFLSRALHSLFALFTQILLLLSLRSNVERNGIVLTPTRYLNSKKFQSEKKALKSFEGKANIAR